MSKVLVDRELLELLRDHMDMRGEFDPTYAPETRPENSEAKFLLELRAILAAKSAEAEGVDIIGYMEGDYRRDQPSIYIPHVRIVKSCARGEGLMTVSQHTAALSAVTAERDRLRDAAEYAIEVIDGLDSNLLHNVCENLRAALAAKEG